MTTRSLCCNCRSPNTDSNCELCEEAVCRSCLRILPSEALAFEVTRPSNLSHTRYCDRCYGQEVEPALAAYETILEKAKEIIYIPQTYRGPLYILKKARTSIEVFERPDRDEVILRLAFIAAKEGYNALIYGEISSRKMRNHGYQKSVWNGRATPALLDEQKLNRNDYLEEVWRRGR